MEENCAKIQVVKKLIHKGKKNNTLIYKEIMSQQEKIDLKFSPKQTKKIFDVPQIMGFEVINNIDTIEVQEEKLDVSIPACNCNK